MRRPIICVLFILSTLASLAFANEPGTAKKKAKDKVQGPATLDPRGPAELVICSQNLANYGTFEMSRLRIAGLSQQVYAEKEAALVTRFASVDCDLIALQEVLGKSELAAFEVLENLAKKLRAKTGRIFEAVTGPSKDPMLRQGYLIAKDRAELINKVGYHKVELPKMTNKRKEKPRLFSRGPLEIQIQVKPNADSARKLVTIVDFHFKSKANAGRDPSGLEWETVRMQMAEALRRIVENRHANMLASSDQILVLLGDRNSNFDSASAKILEGVLALKHFQDMPLCRLSKRGVPLCQPAVQLPQKLFSLLTTDPHTISQPGTFRYKGEFSWIDEILVPAESLRYAWAGYDTPGDYDSGVIYMPKEASDHAMVWAKLNW